MFDPILKGIGSFLSWIDSWAGNYLFVLLIFALLLEILFLPLGIKQQKNSIRQAKLRPKEMAIRNKYKGRNDKVTQQKIQTEIQELYRKENFSQFAGCLPMLIQLPVIIILYSVVINPLLYVVQLSSTTIAEITAKLGDKFSTGNTIYAVTQLRDGSLIEQLKASNIDAGAMADIEQHADSLPNFTVLGINLGETPAINTLSWLLLIPIITFVIYFLSMKLTKKFTYQPTINQDAQAGCSGKVMDWMMPLMSVFISFSVPAAVSFYWIFKSILGTVKQFALQKAMPLPVFTEEDIKAAERELKGKAPLPDREIPAEAVSRHHIDDDDEPYPTFVGVRGGKYDDDSKDEKTTKPTDNDGIGGNITQAPLKEDKKDKNNKKRR